MGHRKAALCVALGWAVSAAPALAAGCQIMVAGTLPVTIDPGRRASVPVRINDHSTTLWLDTGAFFSIMSRAKADEFGLSVAPMPAFGFRVSGIGGSADVEYTRVASFGIAKGNLKNIDFLVGGSDAGNGLIGANILAAWDTELDLAHGVVKLAKAADCGSRSLAYWDNSGAFFTVPILDDPSRPNTAGFRMPVTLNGKKVVAELDTGSPQTVISRSAAEMAGIDLHGPDVVPIDRLSGVGRKSIKGWTVPVADVGIGDEHVLKTRIDVIDGSIINTNDAPEMLLGADFALAHHLYFARARHTVFFTYSGGKPFLATGNEAGGAVPVPATASGIPTGMRTVQAVNAAGAAPTTADGFAQRASVRMDRHDFTGAIADYSEAIRLSPTTALYYGDRARAYAGDHDSGLARADIDKALALDPTQGRLLQTRAELRYRNNDKAGAQSDLEAAAKQIPPASLEILGLAEGFATLGQPSRAAALMGPVIAAHPDDSRFGALLNARCWYRGLANQELPGALDDCNRAIRKFGTNAAILDSRALIHYRQGDYPAAIADYDAALKLNGRQAWSLYMRGGAKAKTGDAAGAKADQDLAKAINPAIVERVSRYGLP